MHEIWQMWVMGSDTEKFVYSSEGLGGTQEGEGFWRQQNQTLSEWGKEVRGYSELAAKVSSDTWMLLGVLLSREQLPESLRPHKLNRQKLSATENQKAIGQAEYEGLLQSYTVIYNWDIFSLLVERKKQGTEEGNTLGKIVKCSSFSCVCSEDTFFYIKGRQRF